MEMACQQQIEPASQKAGKGFGRTSCQQSGLVARWKIERVMGDHHFVDVIGEAMEPGFHRGHLPIVDPAALEGEPSRRIHAGDGEFVVAVEGLQVVGDVVPIRIEPVSESCVEIVQRNVVVSGNDNLRRRQGTQKGTRLLELARPGTLCEVTGDGHNVGVHVMHRLNQLLNHSGVRAAEVHVGKMD